MVANWIEPKSLRCKCCRRPAIWTPAILRKHCDVLQLWHKRRQFCRYQSLLHLDKTRLVITLVSPRAWNIAAEALKSPVTNSHLIVSLNVKVLATSMCTLCTCRFTFITTKGWPLFIYSELPAGFTFKEKALYILLLRYTSVPCVIAPNTEALSLRKPASGRISGDTALIKTEVK